MWWRRPWTRWTVHKVFGNEGNVHKVFRNEDPWIMWLQRSLFLRSTGQRNFSMSSTGPRTLFTRSMGLRNLTMGSMGQRSLPHHTQGLGPCKLGPQG